MSKRLSGEEIHWLFEEWLFSQRFFYRTIHYALVILTQANNDESEWLLKNIFTEENIDTFEENGDNYGMYIGTACNPETCRKTLKWFRNTLDVACDTENVWYLYYQGCANYHFETEMSQTTAELFQNAAKRGHVPSQSMIASFYTNDNDAIPCDDRSMYILKTRNGRVIPNVFHLKLFKSGYVPIIRDIVTNRMHQLSVTQQAFFYARYIFYFGVSPSFPLSIEDDTLRFVFGRELEGVEDFGITELSTTCKHRLSYYRKIIGRCRSAALFVVGTFRQLTRSRDTATLIGKMVYASRDDEEWRKEDEQMMARNWKLGNRI